MKDPEKGKFEDAWQKAFSTAENAPSENVWAGVEQGLNIAETATMKRRVVFYQRLAAASILFALMLGGLSTYYISDLKNQKEMNLTQHNSSIDTDRNEVRDNNTMITSTEIVNDKISNGDKSIIDSSDSGSAENTIHGSHGLMSSNANLTEHNNLVNKDSHTTQQKRRRQWVALDYPSLLSMIPEPSIELNGEMKEVTIVRKLPAMPASFMDSKKDKLPKENLWASLGASSGSYSPNLSSSPVVYANVSSQDAKLFQSVSSASSSTASLKGSVYSVGMNMGKRISKRWLVQGGINYLNQSIGYTSNFAVIGSNNIARASVADYSNTTSFSSVIPVSSPYQINSVNELISVPVQAGYLLVDRKLGLQLNSGLSTDIFMKNTLTDKSGQLSSYSSGASDTSPYRSINWAGLIGTELSYKLGTQYRISMVPGLRYYINSVLKSNSAPSNPLMWDVGFRFRYIFK